MAGSRSGPGLLGLGVALALGLVASAHLVSEALLEIKQESRALVVKGFAERAIVSDYAVWQGSFTTRAADLQTAYAELARHRELLTAFLAGRGVADGAGAYVQPGFADVQATSATISATADRGRRLRMCSGDLIGWRGRPRSVCRDDATASAGGGRRHQYL